MAANDARAPIDTTVKVPAAVLAAAAAADKAHQQAYNPADPPAGDPPAGDPPPPAPAPAPAAKTSIPDSGAPGSWEDRFRSNEGRWEAAQRTIQQQASTISQMNDRQIAMEATLASLQKKAEAPASESLISPEERATWGEDFMSMVERISDQKAASKVEALTGEISSLRQQLGQVTGHVVQSEREKMKEVLSSEVPRWREQNNDPKFLAWLRLQDPYSGAIRGDLLRDAWEKNVTPRVVSIFKGFVTEEAATSPAAAAASAVPGKPSLAEFAAPGRAKAEATPAGAPSEKPTITRSQIAAFYADVRAGKFRGRDKEKDAFEQQIFAAERENRIR